MTSLNQTADPRGATRLLAGILVPGTPIVTRAIEYAREHCEPRSATCGRRRSPLAQEFAFGNAQLASFLG
jgi:hypothetical protein